MSERERNRRSENRERGSDGDIDRVSVIAKYVVVSKPIHL